MSDAACDAQWRTPMGRIGRRWKDPPGQRIRAENKRAEEPIKCLRGDRVSCNVPVAGIAGQEAAIRLPERWGLK